jgi:hypothetical protein
MTAEDIMVLAAVASVVGLVGGIVYSGVRVVVETERAQRLERERDAAWSEGFEVGNDADAKTSRLKTRERLGR